ncbi:hypothetical protein SUDANB145_07284 (plasmid) [Streptomyces sp. enrichment culture]|uniref:hypothetical protein n=1 Tax=Streptomyces sp. enrichment culture TaxID=1795815 RepID=UPI003F553630
MATRTRTRKQTATKKATAKPRPTGDRRTVVDLRKPLPIRRRNPVGPYTAAQLTEARAVLASATAALPIPHLLWLTQIDGRAAARLTDGTLLIHRGPGHRPHFTAYIRCPGGAAHHHTITTAQDLRDARADTALCTRQHATTDQHHAITDGVRPPADPEPSTRVSRLADALTLARHAAQETQPLNRDDITAGLTARTGPHGPTPIQEYPA